MGVLNDEDTASRLSEGGSSLLPAEPMGSQMGSQMGTSMGSQPVSQPVSQSEASLSPQLGSKAGSQAGRRPLKLRNKVYFQLLEATNALQREEAAKAGGAARTVKLGSAQVARLAQIAMETAVGDAKAVEASRERLRAFVPLAGGCDAPRFVQYISQIQSILREGVWRV